MKWTDLKQYLHLYWKSFVYLWRTSPKTVSTLLVIIPLQALLPSATIYIANLLINQVTSLSQAAIVTILMGWAMIFLVNNISTPLVTLIQGKLTDDLTYQLNMDMMSKAQELETIDYYEDNEFYNDIQLLSSEASWRPVNLLVFGTSLISNLILFISMLFVFASFHLVIALLMLLSIIPQAMIAYSLQQQSFEVLVSNSEASRKLEYYSQVLLSSEAIKDVRLYDLYPFFKNKYAKAFAGIKSGVQGQRVKKFRTSALFLTLTTVLSLLSFLYIIWSIRQGQLANGSILLFTSSIVYAISSMSSVIEYSSLLYDTLLYMQRFFQFVEIETPQQPSLGDLSLSIQSIVFDRVTFQYPQNETPTLQEISFEVHAGEKIAIVGENGAGKTTLIKLLLHFYPTSSGHILINSQPLDQIHLETYRQKVAAIFQDFAKFDVTLGENVALSDLARPLDPDQILTALGKSGFSARVEELDQMLGKRFDQSRDLSGGQWQKVALARAFYATSDLLILDEPTAALDARTEYELYERFLELTGGKTVFYITHRLASVKQADKVLLLKEGRIEAFASHEILMQTNSYYQELYDMQASLYQTEE